jgi:hypothetical protein
MNKNVFIEKLAIGSSNSCTQRNETVTVVKYES